MPQLENLVSLIPTTCDFVKSISEALVEYPPSTFKTVRQHVLEEMQKIEHNKTLSNHEKFRVFIKFLYVQIRSEVVDKVMEGLESNFNTPEELARTDANSLVTLLRKLGYRFPDKACTLIEISRILRDKFDGDMDKYIAFVDKNYHSDPVLKTKGVGFKTRDIALSSFTTKYSLVDVHIANVLSRTGLIVRAYLYGLKLTTDRSDDNNYLEITRLLAKLSEEADMMPFELDQTLWFFGKDYCSPMNCRECPANRCVSKARARFGFLSNLIFTQNIEMWSY